MQPYLPSNPNAGESPWRPVPTALLGRAGPVFDAADAPGRCVLHEAPGALRLRLEDRPAVGLDLCESCFCLYAIMRAEDAASSGLLRRVAQALGAQVWLDGGTAYLLKADVDSATLP